VRSAKMDVSASHLALPHACKTRKTPPPGAPALLEPTIADHRRPRAIIPLLAPDPRKVPTQGESACPSVRRWGCLRWPTERWDYRGSAAEMEPEARLQIEIGQHRISVRVGPCVSCVYSGGLNQKSTETGWYS
jgi:hypothetical protein